MLHILYHPAYFTSRLVQGFALFGHQGPGNVFEGILEKLLQPKEIAGTG